MLKALKQNPLTEDTELDQVIEGLCNDKNLANREVMPVVQDVQCIDLAIEAPSPPDINAPCITKKTNNMVQRSKRKKKKVAPKPDTSHVSTTHADTKNVQESRVQHQDIGVPSHDNTLLPFSTVGVTPSFKTDNLTFHACTQDEQHEFKEMKLDLQCSSHNKIVDENQQTPSDSLLLISSECTKLQKPAANTTMSAQRDGHAFNRLCHYEAKGYKKKCYIKKFQKMHLTTCISYFFLFPFFSLLS
ncbi:hypothetical protein RFI_00409 [Reticulomyxa filosa]|uniref:Uncharacterized protein n=1 Tax=Reticulomyxa filosa TaxID=46433 RepID=X6PF23_RETFI|nr:hypothetical protein RFI_00409 [Reticulomyxa filosa]|eukprot:ETO36654.1 hypothetical protein RFI_00409 [Reticulomyxa filosa]